jgi:hypothetical protein
MASSVVYDKYKLGTSASLGFKFSFWTIKKIWATM